MSEIMVQINPLFAASNDTVDCIVELFLFCLQSQSLSDECLLGVVINQVFGYLCPGVGFVFCGRDFRSELLQKSAKP